MAVGIGASGHLGVAFETVSGTYVAPAKFASIRSSSLNYVEDRILRRPLRGHADIAGVIRGNSRIEGDVEIEVNSQILPYFLNAAHGGLVKSGAGPYTYTYTPNSSATTPGKTLSITVTMNGVTFGYYGCVVSSWEFGLDDGLLICTMGIIGRGEDSESTPTPTYDTNDPFGPGQYKVEIPTATQIYDADTFTFTINDNGEAQYRLKDGDDRAAQFIKFGEREVMLSMERDFESRAEFDIFKAATARSITLSAIKTAAADEVRFLLPNAYVSNYEISGLSGQGDLVRASVEYAGAYNAGTSKAAEIRVITDVDVTL